MGQFPEVTWPAEYTELTTIEELLHCKICYEYLETSVVTPCSHNYCSICIRKFLHYKTQCPACYVNLYEKDLHPNRIVDEILTSYLSLRAKLVACVKGAEIKKSNDLSDRSAACPGTPKRKFKEESDANVTLSTPKASHIDSRLVETPKKSIGAPSTSERTPKINTLFVAKSVEKSKPETSGKKVPCPVCGIDISETNINRHLDDCLKRQKSTSLPIVVNNGLEPMPKYVTNLMKDAELRKILKKYGLATLGARKILEKRLQRFSVLYNAERDKLSPKSIRDLVKQCEEEETAEKNLTKINSSDYGRIVDRKTDLNVIEEVRKQYLEKNKDEYQKLIESINQREKRNKKRGRSLFGQTTEDSVAASSSSTSQQTSQSIFDRSDEDTDSSPMNLSQYLPPDSDSSASCPLQHYSNEDPLRFLELEMSSDSPITPNKLEDCSGERKSRVDTEASPDSKSSIDKILSPNPSPRNTLSPISNENLAAAASSRNDIQPSKLTNDIFDASTEDNWSESYCNTVSSELNRTKRLSRKLRVKQSKRTKRWSDNRSSDSETDVEIETKSAGRKPNSIQRPRARESEIKTAGPRNNGSSSPESTTNGSTSFPISEENSKIDKENIKASSIVAGIETPVRRSSRNRNPISYVNNSKKTDPRVNEKKKKSEQVLEECEFNVVGPDDRKSENGTDRSTSGMKKPLRKRRKTVKQ